MKRVAILCVGNDCPGLNAAIRAVVVKASELDIEVLGVKDGFEGFLKDQLDVMTKTNVSGILHKGGTILGTSLLVPEDEEQMKLVQKKVEQYAITSLIILGGRLGVRAALNLSKKNVPSLLIPATIDNDLSFTDFSIGFFTAVENVKNALDVLHSTAESHHRVMIVETMGKPGGWIATVGGLTGGADYVVSSAEPFDPDDLLRKIRTRYEGHKRFSIIVVESGVRLPEDFYRNLGLSQEVPAAQAIGSFVEKNFKEFGVEWRYTNLGYLQRGGSPVAMDRLVATLMATRAVEMIKAARIYHAVGMRGLTVTEVPYSETMLNVRTVEEHLRSLVKLFY
ncbi:6-phosphofructokinase [Thermotoga caldifontis]|uniref:6-phosphofructokinase n=1 Tax=Thermotoga caldifontis TaxID=1508419 RepID=UPI0005971597|nr:6-phosphofructokinase [Thermotoga caldifontis]